MEHTLYDLNLLDLLRLILWPITWSTLAHTSMRIPVESVHFAILYQVFWCWFIVFCTSYVSLLIFCIVVLSITGSEELKAPSVVIELFLILISLGIFIYYAIPLFCAWIFTLLYLIDELILYHYIIFLLVSYNNFWVKAYFV